MSAREIRGSQREETNKIEEVKSREEETLGDIVDDVERKEEEKFARELFRVIHKYKIHRGSTFYTSTKKYKRNEQKRRG